MLRRGPPGHYTRLLPYVGAAPGVREKYPACVHVQPTQKNLEEPDQWNVLRGVVHYSAMERKSRDLLGIRTRA